MSAPDQRGAGTVLVLAMAQVILLVGAALLVAVGLVTARHAAQSAADLAALAGARGHAEGRDGCRSAAAVATADGARLIRCAVSGGVVSVRVEVDGPRWLGQIAALGAEARAGPEP